jgi:hypothetical protein
VPIASQSRIKKKHSSSPASFEATHYLESLSIRNICVTSALSPFLAFPLRAHHPSSLSLPLYPSRGLTLRSVEDPRGLSPPDTVGTSCSLGSLPMEV